MFQDTINAIRHDPSYRSYEGTLVGSPQAEIAATDLLELLLEGSIWGRQVDFIGALINASDTRVRAFDSGASTQLFTSGEPPDGTHRRWNPLDLLLFPLQHHNGTVIIWRLVLADIDRAVITYLTGAEDQGDWEITPHLEHWVAEVAAAEGDTRLWRSQRRAAPEARS